MKYCLSLILLLFLSANAAGIDVDYDFLENAFDGIKPVTNEEFDRTINKLTPQPVENSFKGKIKNFLFGRKYGVEPALKGQEEKIDIGGEKQAIQDVKNGIYYIKLVASIIGYDGSIIPLGNYKIKEEEKYGENLLVFYQGNQEYGRLRLRNYDDKLKNANDIAYSRVDIINDYTIRIVYSTLKATKCAVARVYE